MESLLTTSKCDRMEEGEAHVGTRISNDLNISKNPSLLFEMNKSVGYLENYQYLELPERGY